MKHQLFVLLLVAGAPFLAHTQQTLNFDFERASVEGTGRPWGWSLDAWGDNVFSLDADSARTGQYGLKLYADSGDPPPPALQTNLEPYLPAGKRVELKGYYRSDLRSGNTFIHYGYVTLEAEENYFDSSTVIFQTEQSTRGWEEFRVAFSVPDNAITVYLKIGLHGEGTVWYDDFALLVDGVAYTTELPVASAFTERETSWVRENVHPFAAVENPATQTFAGEFFRQAVGDARIVALGESTHGTSEFFRLKHLVFKYLVEEVGFRVFALEDHMLACEKVNRFIFGRLEADAEEAMSHFFAVWYTAEMKALITWMKAWNEAHPTDPVYFAGFDLQDYRLPLAAVREYLAGNAPALLSELEGYERFAADVYTATDSTKTYWRDKLAALHASLSERGTARADDLRNVVLLRQYTENVLRGHWSFYRDEAMADNLAWLAEVKYPKQRIFVWAHDVHVAQAGHAEDIYNLTQGKAMGRFLKQKFGDDYQAYGIATYSGAYLALKSYSNHERVHAPLYPAPVGSWEHALHQVATATSESALFLDFSAAKNRPARPLPFRFANHVSIDYGFFTQISVPDQFDGLFFIDHTGPTRYLGKK